METLAHLPGAPGGALSSSPAASTPAAARTHWAWWVFLLGVLACSLAGPVCALN